MVGPRDGASAGAFPPAKDGAVDRVAPRHRVRDVGVKQGAVGEMGSGLEWRDGPPRESGVYWYMDDLDTLAEDICIVRVDLAAGDGGEVAYHGRPTRPLVEHRGLWLGPVPEGRVPGSVRGA